MHKNAPYQDQFLFRAFSHLDKKRRFTVTNHSFLKFVGCLFCKRSVRFSETMNTADESWYHVRLRKNSEQKN